MNSPNNIKVKSKKTIFLREINIYRRKLTKFLTKNIGNSHYEKIKPLADRGVIKRILVVRPNHRLGNLLLTTPLVQEVTSVFPNSKIDLLAKGNLAPIIFSEYKNINKYYLLPRKPFQNLLNYTLIWVKIKSKNYDLVINAVNGSSSGKLLTQLANAKYKLYGELDNHTFEKSNDELHIAKNPIYNLRKYLGFLKIKIEDTPIASLNLMLTSEELFIGEKIINKTFKNGHKTISIFTYATGSKCYSKVWWNKFYDELKNNFPSYNILEILPVENVSQINFDAQTYYSKNIRDIASVIANTAIFIGADSGIMHLASASKTRTIGLFSRTNIERYKPYGNSSIALNTEELSIENCIEKVKQNILKEEV